MEDDRGPLLLRERKRYGRERGIRVMGGQRGKMRKMERKRERERERERGGRGREREGGRKGKRVSEEGRKTEFGRKQYNSIY